MALRRPLVWSLLAAAGTVGALVMPTTLASAAPTPYVADPAALVNPIIGTTNGVNDFPGADVPFGMVQWSPDTPSRDPGSGYDYTDNKIIGYSFNHLSGPGCGALGDVPVLPTVGAIGTNPGAATQPLDHSTEQASAGYYKMASGGITTELSTTTRSGMARFTFPSSDASNLLFKLSDSAAGTDATHFQVINDHEVAGWVTSGHFCGAKDLYTVYFDMQFDQSFTAQGTWQNSTVSAGTKQLDAKPGTPPAAAKTGKHPAPTIHGTKAETPQVSPPVAGADGAYLTFDTTKNPVVQAKLGLSYVSTDNAVANRQAENPGWNFNAVKQNAHNAWKTMLNRVQIGGGSTTDQTVFYTALYHALLHPNVFSDVNGEYMGFDDQVHHVTPGHVQYANYSGWDIYRSQVQLAAIVAPQQTSDSIRSMLNDYDQSGQLPKWALNNGESYVMVGDPADSIIADAYAFGARDFDTQHALQAMLAEANQTNNIRPGLNYYQGQGYLPMDGTYGCCNFYGPASTQLEYDVADHSVATFASALGDSTDAAKLDALTNNWVNVYNPGSAYMQPKYTNGQFQTGFVPTTLNGFVENSAAQYTPMVPFDIQGLARAAGGNTAWVKRLDSMNTNLASPTLMNTDLSNEPSLEIPWEYDYVGAPYRTQEVVRQVEQQLWTDKPAGFIGNDDLGTMSASYVWDALGMYPETPGSGTLALGSPMFPKAAIHLSGNKVLTLNAPQAAPNAPYIQSLNADGKSWSHAYVPTGDIANGGTLDFTLGTTPNTSWGSKPADAPPSDTTNLIPALGYTNPSAQTILTPGSTSTISVGVQGLSTSAQSVSWKTVAGSQITTGPANGTVSVPAGGNVHQSVAITAPATDGRYLVSFQFTSSTGVTLPTVSLEVDVAKPGELWPYYNNDGVSADNATGAADYDGDGYAYSANALAALGITPGSTITSDGLKYTWPSVANGQLDNIEAGGQTLPLPATSGATKIGVLGSATNANPGAQGDFVVTYTDGSTQKVHFGLSDWTLGAGAFPPAFGNTIVATTAYRNQQGGGSQTVKTYLFTADTALTAGKTVQSITLPMSPDQGQFHIFAVTTG